MKELTVRWSDDRTVSPRFRFLTFFCTYRTMNALPVVTPLEFALTAGTTQRERELDKMKGNRSNNGQSSKLPIDIRSQRMETSAGDK